MEIYPFKRVLTESDEIYVKGMQKRLSSSKAMHVLGARERVDKLSLTREEKAQINKEIREIEVKQDKRAALAVDEFREYFHIASELDFAQDQYRVAYEEALFKAIQGMWKYHYANLDVLSPGNCAHMRWAVQFLDEVMDLILDVKYVGIELLKELRYIDDVADPLIDFIIANGDPWNRNVTTMKKQRQFAYSNLQNSGFKLWMVVRGVKARKMAKTTLRKVVNGAAEFVMF